MLIEEKQHQRISFLLVGGLFSLRVPFLAGIALFSSPIPRWLTPIYEIGSYLLIACLLWWERDRLANFHIDGLAFWIIVIFKPFQTLCLKYWGVDSTLAFPNTGSLMVFAISIGLVIVMQFAKRSLPRPSLIDFKWFGIGLVVGIVMVLLLAYPKSLEINAEKKLLFDGRPTILNLFNTTEVLYFFYQLGSVIMIEPLIRGFLWGYLKESKWKDLWILLLQAGVSMLAFSSYVNRSPISFWFIIPVSALILGWLVWRSKTLSSSLSAHALGNVFIDSIGRFIAFYRV